jgi:hypothetical protein
VKSTEVYAALRTELAPAMKAMGFKREKSMLSWSRHAGGSFTVVWCQVSQDGWDDYSGSEFTVEIQRSVRSEPGTPSSYRRRIGKSLSPSALEEVRRFQNVVVGGLSRPPPTHPAFHISPELTSWYRAKFLPVAQAYTASDDVWLRYALPSHVEHWGKFIALHATELVCLAENEA